MSIGARIAKYRRDIGWSQAQLAARAGMSRSGLEKIEQGQRQPFASTLRLLADALAPEFGWSSGRMMEALTDPEEAS